MFRVDGSELTSTLRQLMQNVPQFVDIALRELLKLLRAAARRVVPEQTGNLKRGIGYRVSNGTGIIFARTDYGDSHRRYAIVVHEDLEAVHDPGKEAKFIEHPLLRMTGDGTLVGKLSSLVARGLARKMKWDYIGEQDEPD